MEGSIICKKCGKKLPKRMLVLCYEDTPRGKLAAVYCKVCYRKKVDREREEKNVQK